MAVFRSVWEIDSEDLDSDEYQDIPLERALVEDNKHHERYLFEEGICQIFNEEALRTLDDLVEQDRLMYALVQWAEHRELIPEGVPLRLMFSPYSPEEDVEASDVMLEEDLVDHPWSSMAYRRYGAIWRWQAWLLLEQSHGQIAEIPFCVI